MLGRQMMNNWIWACTYSERDTVQVNQHISPPHFLKQPHINNPSVITISSITTFSGTTTQIIHSHNHLYHHNHHTSTIYPHKQLYMYHHVFLESHCMNNSSMQQALPPQSSEQPTVNNSSMQPPYTRWTAQELVHATIVWILSFNTIMKGNVLVLWTVWSPSLP